MAEQASSEAPPAAEAGGGVVKGIMKWLAIGIGFFAIATVSPLVSQKLFGIPGAGQEAGVDEAVEPKGPPQYIAIDPSLIASVADGQVMRFLQVDVQLMTRDPEAAVAIQTHEPVIRNNLLMLLSAQSLKSLSSKEGKEALRASALAEIQEILVAEGSSASVDDLYFTGFVIQ